MSFSVEWEEIYKNNNQIARWPWTDLVSYFMRYIKPQKNMKILEFGFGSGPNIPFFKRIGADFYGMEGSETIVNAVRQNYPEYAKNIVCCDFTKEIPFDTQFDVIVDRSAITFNKNSDIEKITNIIYDKLKPNGYYIGVDWFSFEHSEIRRPHERVDENSFIFKEGYWKDSGVVHLCNEKYLRNMLKKFQIKKLVHKKYTSLEYEEDKFESDSGIEKLASWDFVAKKVENNE